MANMGGLPSVRRIFLDLEEVLRSDSLNYRRELGRRWRGANQRISSPLDGPKVVRSGERSLPRRVPYVTATALDTSDTNTVGSPVLSGLSGATS
jgi:hypothetical protein